ncbi:hypothetical protein BMS3Bbin14_00495 [bacterium BMS3Bbin14]|nr:hypothetical protein BMS3Bbin14_00495 [bacterium BMS3Bbin14]
MNKTLFSSVCLIALCIVFTHPAFATEIQSRYVTLQYSGKRMLREFDNKLIMGRKLSAMMRGKDVETVEDEVKAKVNLIVEKTEVVLNMFPDKMHVTLVLLPDADDVAKQYKQTYGERQEDIAYYALSEKTIYISVDDTNLRVLAHEMGHAVVDHYFKVRPPYKIHELMAQFAEKHITD